MKIQVRATYGLPVFELPTGSGLFIELNCHFFDGVDSMGAWGTALHDQCLTRVCQASILDPLQAISEQNGSTPILSVLFWTLRFGCRMAALSQCEIATEVGVTTVARDGSSMPSGGMCDEEHGKADHLCHIFLFFSWLCHPAALFIRTQLVRATRRGS